MACCCPSCRGVSCAPETSSRNSFRATRLAAPDPARFRCAVCAQRPLCAPARARAVAFPAPAFRPLGLVRTVQPADVCVLGGARQADPGSRAVSAARSLARWLARYPRRGAAPVRRGLHPRRREAQRREFRFVLQGRLEAFLPEVVRRRAAVRARVVPEHGCAAADDPTGQGRDVRVAAAGQQTQSAPRSVRRFPALSPGPDHAELRRLPDLRRRSTVFLARR